MRTVIILMLMQFMSLTAKSQPHFRTAELKRLADAVGLKAEQIVEGSSVYTVNGQSIVARRTGDEINHMGMSLFPVEMKASIRAVLPDFLERYFLSMKYPPKIKTVKQMLRDDRVEIEDGNLTVVNQLRQDDHFSYALEQNKYTVTWTRNGKQLLKMSFPNDFELLYGTTQLEAEQQIERDIMQSPSTSFQPVSAEELTPASMPGYFIRKGSFFMSEDLTNDRYYQCDSIGRYHLINSSVHPLETAANMMLCAEMAGNRSLDVTEILYGFKECMFSVPLRQWGAYCRNSGCTLYYATEKMDNMRIEGIVLAVNATDGYNHMLTVEIPLNSIDGDDTHVKATLYPFIPTHNIRNIFGKYHKKKQKRERIYLN